MTGLTHALPRSDLASAFSGDTVPRFPLPVDLTDEMRITPVPDILRNTVETWNEYYPFFTDITTTLCHLARLASIINERNSFLGFWRDTMFTTRTYLPVVHEVLLLPRLDSSRKYQNSQLPGIVMREVIRLACLTLLSLINDKFNIRPDGIEAYRGRIRKILNRFDIDWSPFWQLKLWVLVVGSLPSRPGERGWYAERIADTMKSGRLLNWQQVVKVVKGMIWIDAVKTEGIATLEVEVQNALIGKEETW